MLLQDILAAGGVDNDHLEITARVLQALFGQDRVVEKVVTDIQVADDFRFHE